MRQALDSLLVLLGVMAAEVVVVGGTFGLIWAAAQFLAPR